MDPNANLLEQRTLAAQIVAHHDDRCGCQGESECRECVDDAAGRLAELVQALDEWISAGGFLPAAWTARVPR